MRWKVLRGKMGGEEQAREATHQGLTVALLSPRRELSQGGENPEKEKCELPESN